MEGRPRVCTDSGRWTASASIMYGLNVPLDPTNRVFIYTNMLSFPKGRPSGSNLGGPGNLALWPLEAPPRSCSVHGLRLPARRLLTTTVLRAVVPVLVLVPTVGMRFNAVREYFIELRHISAVFSPRHATKTVRKLVQYDDDFYEGHSGALWL